MNNDFYLIDPVDYEYERIFVISRRTKKVI